MTQSPVATLRRFVREREPKERCNECGCGLQSRHAHKLNPNTGLISCVCQSCMATNVDSNKLIPSRFVELQNFDLADAEWNQLMIPISLAFFTFNTPANKWVAFYPGPAGATEATLPEDAWHRLMIANPELGGLQPDVEALLVNRVGPTRDYFLVPIDACYELVGLIRLHWRGFSGGALVWGEILRYFENLRRRVRE